MQFVTGNYIWFLIIGIVILMVVIGYIAEKTDFGHKDVGKKEKKDKKKKEKRNTRNLIRFCILCL